MRIITGQYKGRHFQIPPSFSARPTTDFAKENLFNVLRAYLDFEETRALDLFGGTEDCGTAADREHEAAERLDDICRLIDCLSEEQRQILRWRIFENIPFKEIAEREHISINTALGRMRYALLNMSRLAVERDLQPYVC